MNKILEETLAQHKADLNFEQRMLAGFRNRVPERTGLLKWVADLMRLRAAQITAVAAVLLGLVQLGRMITGETDNSASALVIVTRTNSCSNNPHRSRRRRSLVVLAL